MNLLSKIILLVLYPWIWLFHPRMRRYHTLRVKYWAADHDFFREERQALGRAAFIGVFMYLFLFWGIGAMFSTGVKVSHEIRENYRDARRDAYESISSNPEDRLVFDANVEDKTERVEVTEEDHAARAKEIETREDISKDEDAAEALLLKALEKKKCRESGNC